MWLRGVSSGMPSAIKRCTEGVISSTASGAILDAASALYRAVLGTVPSAVLARIRAPSRAQSVHSLGAAWGAVSAQCQATLWHWFGRQLGAVSGATSALVGAQSRRGLDAIGARFWAPSGRGFGRHRGAVLGAIGARLWAPSGCSFGCYRGVALGAIGVRLWAPSRRWLRAPFRRRLDRDLGSGRCAISGLAGCAISRSFRALLCAPSKGICVPFRAPF